MKNKLILALSLLCLTTSKAFSQKQDTVLRLKGVTMENDYHDKISWIKSKPIPLEIKDFTVSAYDVSYIQVYFGLYMEDSVQKITPIRIVNAYNNSEWIFFDEVSYLIGSRADVRAGKGKVFQLFDEHTNTKVENGVTEKSDVVASDVILQFIQYVADNSIPRMECKYINNDQSESFTLVITKKTMKKMTKHFKAFVDSYNQVTSKLSLENQLTAQ